MGQMPSMGGGLGDIAGQWRPPQTPRPPPLPSTPQQQMTHQAQGPNPAAPYLEAAKRFMPPVLGGTGRGGGGIADVLQRQPGVMSHLAGGLGEAAAYSTPLGGIMMPVGGALRPGMVRMGEPTANEAAQLRGNLPTNENIAGGAASPQETLAQSFRESGVHDDFINDLWEGSNRPGSPALMGYGLKGSTPDEILQSTPLWDSAGRISRMTGVPEHEVFAHIANKLFQRAGANRWMTPQQAKQFMSQYMGGPTPVE